MKAFARNTRIISIIFAAVWLFSVCGGVFAETRLPDGVLIADDKGMRASKTGEYFLDVQKIRPGEVYTKRLTIKNQSKGEPFRILLLAGADGNIGLAKTGVSAATGGAADLLAKTRLTLSMDGKILYSGSARGNAEGNDFTKTPLNLGIWKQGQERVLNITLKLDEGWRIGYKKSEAIFDWTFTANRSAAPKTGDSFLRSAWLLAGLFALAAGALIVYTRRRKQG